MNSHVELERVLPAKQEGDVLHKITIHIKQEDRAALAELLQSVDSPGQLSVEFLGSEESWVGGSFNGDMIWNLE